MTEAQCTESSQRSRSSARHPLSKSEHDAPDNTATMSSHGLPEFSSITPGLNERSTHLHNEMSDAGIRHAHTQTSEQPFLKVEGYDYRDLARPGLDQRRDKKPQPTSRRIQFGEFAEQLRQQLYFERRRSLLKQRIKVLQKTITLSARLHRVGLWVRDGLVEISAQSDKIGFARVRQNFQDLTEVSYSHWDQELRAIDPLCRPKTPNLEPAGSSDPLAKLSSNYRTDLLELLTCIRSNPRFLAQRFKLLTPNQIVSLQNAPRASRRSNAVETRYPRESQDQYHRSFSKSLEEYATSLERSNPLSFLLSNVYGTDQSSVDAENQLRLSTWSEVCAELMLTSYPAYEALVLHLLDHFASLHEWRAKEGVELFLMGMLQQGSFLLDQSSGSQATRRPIPHNPVATPEAREFFDTCALDFFELLLKYDGGFPTGALQFAAAVLDRLPAVQQAKFRGTFLSTWFTDRFLWAIIHFPENESMLLKYHISHNARSWILNEFYHTILSYVETVLSGHPHPPVDAEIQDCVLRINSLICSAKSTAPYVKLNRASIEQEEHCKASFTISLSEIVHLLDTLSPQEIQERASVDQMLAISTSHDHAIYSRYRFNGLKAALISTFESGVSTKVHPCQEQWVQIAINSGGKPELLRIRPENEDILTNFKSCNLDSAQQGALRLFKDHMSDSALPNGASFRSDLLKAHSLEKLFEDMANYTSAKHDPIGCNYWSGVLAMLHKKYPLSRLLEDDSAILQPMFQNSRDIQDKCRENCLELEVQLGNMENICLMIRSSIDKSVDGFESLRLKLWYSTDVVASKVYENARYVARALNNMATSSVTSATNSHQSSQPSFLNGRPMSPHSVASETYERPYRDTMNAMKASVRQGGPKKLSDEQIRLTNIWLTQTPIEIFCAGEERIHRFCMEVHNAAHKLAGETLLQSPELWTSNLFEQEQGLYNTHYYSSYSAPASSRAPSISNSSTSYNPPSGTDSLKMLLVRDVFTPKSANSLRLSSRAHSATTVESASSVFSHMPRSQTSASVYSKSPSNFNSPFNPVFNEPDLSRFEDKARDKAKAKFLARVKQVLICLLLSDLSCPVWTMGSETDALLQNSRKILDVNERLKQRMLAESIADCTRRGRIEQQGSKARPRSQSVLVQATGPRTTITSPTEQSDDHSTWLSDDDHQVNLKKLLIRLNQQVDPMEKIAVIKEFYGLSLSTLSSRSLLVDEATGHPQTAAGALRRSSLDEHILRSRGQNVAESLQATRQRDIHSYSDHEITQHIKSDLVELCPTTLFRDLQYISAFVPAEFMGNGPGGEALTHVGLAAFAYKDEVCRSMVDVADKMFSQIRDPSSQPELVQQVANLWISAAQEGNPVAQRELALLYLSQFTILPVTLPLSRPSQIFPSERYGRHIPYVDTALCLALHWLKEASKKGDKLAKQKLDERAGAILIR